MYARVLTLCCALMVIAWGADASRDGHRFDTGATMTAPAAGAPEQTGQLSFLVGQWDVVYETFAGDSLTARAEGTSEVTFMNRGHGLMERFFCGDHDGNGTELSTIAFIVYNKTQQLWVHGTANSHTESISMYSGTFSDDRLVLQNARRKSGGAVLTMYRRTTSHEGNDHVVVEREESVDFGATWQVAMRMRYTRRTPSDTFMAMGDGYGEAAPDVPDEARQFDFLIGEWNNSHDITRPNGQNIKFTTNATAVFVLNGHAIMEFSWFDQDPNLPDAATTIVRIYNRQMRRWESMYCTNRFSSVLYFGGAKEGNRIVLHKFDADVTDGPISQWVFHDMKADSYSWYGQSSTDRGATWKKTWIIDAARKTGGSKAAQD